MIILEIETEFFSFDLVLPTTSLTLREIRYRLAREQSCHSTQLGGFPQGRVHDTLPCIVFPHSDKIRPDIKNC